MDRFIEELEKCDAGTILSLKSNMDRFIARRRLQH